MRAMRLIGLLTGSLPKIDIPAIAVSASRDPLEEPERRDPADVIGGSLTNLAWPIAVHSQRRPDRGKHRHNEQFRPAGNP